MAASAELMAKALPGSQGGTYGANAVACAAAVATLDVIEEEKLVDNTRDMGDALTAGLTGLASSRPRIRDVRGPGLMVGVELVTADGQPDAALTAATEQHAVDEGLLPAHLRHRQQRRAVHPAARGRPRPDRRGHRRVLPRTRPRPGRLREGPHEPDHPHLVRRRRRTDRTVHRRHVAPRGVRRDDAGREPRDTRDPHPCRRPRAGRRPGRRRRGRRRPAGVGRHLPTIPRRHPAARLRAPHQAHRPDRGGHDRRDGQAAGRCTRGGGLRSGVLPLVLRGGDSARRFLRHHPGRPDTHDHDAPPCRSVPAHHAVELPPGDGNPQDRPGDRRPAAPSCSSRPRRHR